MSLITYLGNRALVRSWVWWYLARPFIGMSVVFLLYAAIRGGILETTASADLLNVYFVTIVAAIAGAYSKDLLDRMSSVGKNSEMFTPLGSTNDKLGTEDTHKNSSGF